MNPNAAGKIAENIIADILRGVGLHYRRQVEVGESIYPGQVLHADFLVTNLVAFPDGLAIESKWQDRPGSIDEKFPCVELNIRTRYRVPAIVVVHGAGCRPGALQWFRNQCDGVQLVAVLRLEEFVSWAIRSPKYESSHATDPKHV